MEQGLYGSQQERLNKKWLHKRAGFVRQDKKRNIEHKIL